MSVKTATFPTSHHESFRTRSYGIPLGEHQTATIFYSPPYFLIRHKIEANLVPIAFCLYISHVNYSLPYHLLYNAPKKYLPFCPNFHERALLSIPEKNVPASESFDCTIHLLTPQYHLICIIFVHPKCVLLPKTFIHTTSLVTLQHLISLFFVHPIPLISCHICRYQAYFN